MKVIFFLFLSYLLIVSRLYSLSITSYFQRSVSNVSLKPVRKIDSKKRKISHNNKKRTHDKEEWMCPNCRQKFSNKSNLSQHKKRVPCQICQKSFASRGALNMHIKGSERCRKMLIEKADSNEKLVNYDQKEDWICQSCGQIFTGKNRLAQHMLKKHQYFDNNQQKLTCDLCGSVFLKRASLKTHLQRKHSQKSQCDICKDRFFTDSELQVHRKDQHFDLSKKFHCETCQKRFRQRYLLKAHIGKEHSKQMIDNEEGSSYEDDDFFQNLNEDVNETKVREVFLTNMA